ncbi:MAG: hypothetical protein MUF15_10115 [Acidobacteria bacterium]|jgi:hypothetical protein|nr:hypothetical protein [Acidobacteriota bacterium]
MNENVYRKPVRVFEKSGSVNPEMSYYIPLENVVNTDNQDIKTMVDRGRYFSITVLFRLVPFTVVFPHLIAESGLIA